MKESLTEVLTFQLKKLVPLSFSLILILAGSIPFHFSIAKYIIPELSIICVYFWASYRQDLFGIGSAFFLGMVADCLSLSPLGLNISVNMTTFVLTNIFRSYVNTRLFIVSWGGFALVAFGAYGSKWLIASVYYSKFLSLAGVCLGYAATLLIYPLIARLNIYIQNLFLTSEEAVYEQG